MAQKDKVIWRSPSNIALVKYWGKCGSQLPCNPSVSMTLSKSYTETEIKFSKKKSFDGISLEFLFNEKKNPKFEPRIRDFIDAASTYIPVLQSLHLKIKSKNTFPHSAGIASSASAFSSIALGLCSIENEIEGINNENGKFHEKASAIARLGSGSASRSVYGGWVLWGDVKEVEGSSDKFSIPVTEFIHDKFKNLNDIILIVRSGSKRISSSFGHKLMKDNPYKEIKYKKGKENTVQLLNALKKGDHDNFGTIVENEAASLHAMFMTSNPSFILMEPATLHIIEKIRKFRKKTDMDICYTLDAGPNVHLLYPDKLNNEIMSFIKDDLLQYCENHKYIEDKAGSGPERIN